MVFLNGRPGEKEQKHIIVPSFPTSWQITLLIKINPYLLISNFNLLKN
jgi:hypothetical protein